MALRQRSTGVAGSPAPKEAYIWSCRAANRLSASASELWLRATVMSTMEPEAMLGGSRIDGNSICGRGHGHQHRNLAMVKDEDKGHACGQGQPCDGMRRNRSFWRMLHGSRRRYAGGQAYMEGEGIMAADGSRPTSRLSGVSSTVTPASTLPTVRETNMAGDRCSSGRWAGSREGVAGVEKGQVLVAI